MMKQSRKSHCHFLGCLLLCICIQAIATGAAQAKRNIILMISDGAGFHTWQAASMYQGRWDNAQRKSRQVYDGPGWVNYGCTTYSLNADGQPMGYDIDKMWSDFNYAISAYTDSAASATALNTGQKTYNGAVSVDSSHRPIQTIAEIAQQQGLATGSVTSVPLSHATPACVDAHNSARGNYAAIAKEIVYGSELNVVMGAGHCEYDDNGKPAEASDVYIGGKTTLAELREGKTGKGWTFIEQKSEFEKLADFSQPTPERVFGLAQVNSTLQASRSTPELNDNVPNLATMTKAALNVLDNNPEGLFLMVEGGAVDWANHGNDLDLAIAEQIDFNEAVEAVVQWVEQSGGWENTLVILTADHECGYLWGPEAYTQLIDNGPGKTPGHKYFHNSHSNMLVPVYTKGVGSELFEQYAKNQDPKAAELWGFSGRYFDNTDIFRVMATVAKTQKAVHPPATNAAPAGLQQVAK